MEGFIYAWQGLLKTKGKVADPHARSHTTNVNKALPLMQVAL